MSFGLFDNVKVYQLPVVDFFDPFIELNRAGQNISIHFIGNLERATSITGPWIPVTNAESPYEQAIDSGVDQEFFRAVR